MINHFDVNTGKKSGSSKRRAILLHGGAGKPYDQAIFIVREDLTKIPKDAVSEAERIVEEYVTKLKKHDAGGWSGFEEITTVKNSNAAKRGRSRLDVFLSGAALLACLALFAAFYAANFI